MSFSRYQQLTTIIVVKFVDFWKLKILKKKKKNVVLALFCAYSFVDINTLNLKLY